MSAPIQRRGRAAAPLPPAPPFPSTSLALLTPAAFLPTFISSLALPSSYNLSTTSARSLLKLTLYSFALAPQSPHRALLFGTGAFPSPGEVGDDWTLAELQGIGGGEYSEGRRGKVCGHVFKAGESVYRCRDCALDATCVLCAKCFQGSSHAKGGHDVTLSIHAGVGAGCCDCGDEEAFREGAMGVCKYHSIEAGGMGEKVEEKEVESLKAAIEETLRVLVDWMIGVLEESPDEMIAPKTIKDIDPGIRDPSTSPPATSSDSSSTVLPSPTSRGKARASSPTPAGPWSVVLWNDEKHSFAQVIDQVSRATGVSRAEAAAVAQRVDIFGRDVIYVSPDTTQLLFVSHLIANIDLAVTVRPALDTFYEQVAGELVAFMKDLCAAKVGGEGGVFTEVLANVLLERVGARGLSRFQRLVGVDARLWKEARKGLAEVYVTLLGVSQSVKTELSVHFAQIYSNVAESYLLTDREPENSIIFFGVQVVTVPSVSAFLVAEHQFLSGLISILYSFFTEQLDPADRKHLVLPPNPTIHRIDPESPAFKQKRYFQVFGDLNHLISSPPVRRLLCDSIPLIEDFAAFLDLFTSMNPNKRAISTHVEYESDTWVTAFNVTIQLGKVCRSFGEAYRLATPLQLARALSTLLARMSGPRANVHHVSFGGRIYQLIDFKVENSPVSFHHPLAWLFSEMVKNVEALDSAALQAIGVASLSDIALGRAGQLHFLAAMDHPLRVVVLVAQIRAGLWVRNGFGMRAQQLHYKEYSLRENTYDQDIFFLQTAFVILDPSLVLIAILDRFQVQDWLGGDDAHPTYESSQAFAMVEEMLYLLIVFLSDPTYAAGLAPETCLRRELIHNLCLGPSAYSDLMRRVSEKFTDDPALDRILADVAIFKLPVGINDQGTYTLRTECFAEVDPYFPRYSRNQREEADKLVREQMKKDAPDSDPIIVPSPLSISSGPFVTISQAFNSDVLHQIIFFAMQHGRARGTLFSEVLVDEALHLSMLALVEQPESFACFAAGRVLSNTPGESTLVHLLVKVEEDERMKAVRHKARWCLDRLAERVGASVNALRKVEDTASPAKALDVKRLAAKARQAAILKQFAAAQKSFLESSENIDDEEDDEMDGEEQVSSLGSCIVCQDELDASRPFGSLGLIQTSNILRLTPEAADFDFQSEVLATPSSLDRDASSLRPFGLAAKKISANPDDETGDGLSKGFPQHNVSGLHASACGHMMHQSCFETYYRSLEQRHHLQPTRCHPENTERREFICPLCKSLGNVLLPASVEGDVYEQVVVEGEGLDLHAWARAAMKPDGRAPLLQLSQDEPRNYSYETDPIQLALNLRHKPRHGITPWEIATTLPESKPEEFEAGERLMIAGMLEVAHSLMQEIGTDALAFLPKELIGYTISAIEAASRGQGEAPIPQATERMLRSLLLSLRELAFVATRSESSLRIATFATIPHLGGMFNQDERRADFFQLDPLTTLVEISAVYPSDFYHVAAFAFYTELVKVYFGIAKLVGLDSDVLAFQGDAADEAIPDYLALAQLHLLFVAPSDSQTPAFFLTLGKRLYAYVLPFLRRAAILHSAVFGPPPPDAAFATGSELSRLLTLLRIPHPSDALRTSGILPPGVGAIQAHIEACQNSIPGWKQSLGSPPPGGVEGATSLPLVLPEASVSCAGELQHPAIYELVGLPVQLDTLAAESLQRKCERCHQVPSEPALCLLCGQMVCHQSFCCMDGEDEAQHGECNMHMWTCGGSVGIYFLVKKNSVLYLYADKGTFSTPPYLDSHGEVDLGGRRGRNQFPQFLHQGRYDEIRKSWLNHGVPTFVARKLEAITDHGGWTTM